MITNNNVSMTVSAGIVDYKKAEAQRTDAAQTDAKKFTLWQAEDCPYGHLAKDGSIEYNGAANTICLGDMSDPKQVLDIAEQLKKQVEKFIKDHKLDAEHITAEKDWREMSEEQWEKLLEHYDKYLDAHKEDLEQLKEKMDEAARKAAANAPAAKKVLAASRAALQVAAGGTSDLQKLSWTYQMETEDQTVLAQAKMANERAQDALTKAQELSLLGYTTEGIRGVENAAECAVCEDSEGKKKTWKVTAFTEQGIICNESTDGVTKELWRITYKDEKVPKKVWEYLSKHKEETELGFAGDKDFWERFLDME